MSIGWSAWSAWSTCTVPCNSSDTSIRTRACQAAETAFCIGHAEEEKPCPGCTGTCLIFGKSHFFERQASCHKVTAVNKSLLMKYFRHSKYKKVNQKTVSVHFFSVSR